MTLSSPSPYRSLINFSSAVWSCKFKFTMGLQLPNVACTAFPGDENESNATATDNANLVICLILGSRSDCLARKLPAIPQWPRSAFRSPQQTKLRSGKDALFCRIQLQVASTAPNGESHLDKVVKKSRARCRRFQQSDQVSLRFPYSTVRLLCTKETVELPPA